MIPLPMPSHIDRLVSRILVRILIQLSDIASLISASASLYKAKTHFVKFCHLPADLSINPKLSFNRLHPVGLNVGESWMNTFVMTV